MPSFSLRRMHPPYVVTCLLLQFGVSIGLQAHIQWSYHEHFHTKSDHDIPSPKGLRWLIFLIGPLYSIGMWFSEDQRANIKKTNV